MKENKTAIDVVRQMIADGNLVQEVAERYFPELAESEDERIRKALIRAFKSLNTIKVWNGIECTDILAWLEKQGEHANFRNKIQIGDKVTRNEDGELVNISQLKRVAKKDEKQDEQKPAEEYNITGISSNKSQGKLGEIIKNLKTTWGEDDCNKISSIKYLLHELDNYNFDSWLDSLKYKLQYNKPVCNEHYINDLIKHFSQNEKLKNTKEDIIIWLKSLKSQKRWKPSEEQMKALANALSLAKNCGEESSFDLRTLYEQLKAL